MGHCFHYVRGRAVQLINPQEYKLLLAVQLRFAGSVVMVLSLYFFHYNTLLYRHMLGCIKVCDFTEKYNNYYLSKSRIH